MIKLSRSDEDTLRSKFKELTETLDALQQYLGRKTAKVMSLTMDLEKLLDVGHGLEPEKRQEPEKKAPDKG